MPELVNNRVGSFDGTSDADGTMVWSLERKKSRKVERISAVFMSYRGLGAARHVAETLRPESRLGAFNRRRCLPHRRGLEHVLWRRRSLDARGIAPVAPAPRGQRRALRNGDAAGWRPDPANPRRRTRSARGSRRP